MRISKMRIAAIEQCFKHICDYLSTFQKVKYWSYFSEIDAQ